VGSQATKRLLKESGLDTQSGKRGEGSRFSKRSAWTINSKDRQRDVIQSGGGNGGGNSPPQRVVSKSNTTKGGGGRERRSGKEKSWEKEKKKKKKVTGDWNAGRKTVAGLYL